MAIQQFINHSIVHKPFLICYTEDGNTIYNGRTIYSLIDFIEQKVEKFIAEDEEIKAPNFLVYFHNLSYDAEI